ncbi:MAG: hypothetical protein KAJ14_04880 [Candidatus Omnitrophica bacterium]|nr:hypothetical protein [Candidatus Omnitrophota bacterium]MCK5287433.1 hypothetical protein [Candidatus Omnitrophota bacterium]MCK5492427.1 hypothetical protein [Candidatus Omnitrophota bacterium]
MSAQDDFKSMTGKVNSVSEHEDAPYTIEIETKSFLSRKNDAVTVDPRCTFYKSDKNLKDIDIIARGDNIKITYFIHEGIKIAMNVIVMPK